MSHSPMYNFSIKFNYNINIRKKSYYKNKTFHTVLLELF